MLIVVLTLAEQPTYSLRVLAVARIKQVSSGTYERVETAEQSCANQNDAKIGEGRRLECVKRRNWPPIWDGGRIYDINAATLAGGATRTLHYVDWHWFVALIALRAPGERSQGSSPSRREFAECTRSAPVRP